MQIQLGYIHMPVHNTTLRCIAFASTLVETQRNARIHSDPIFVLHSCSYQNAAITQFLHRFEYPYKKVIYYF